MPRVVVVGGGIAGLAAAYQLRALMPDLDIALLEREDRLGGKIRTERANGYVVEGGPDSFLSSKPAGLELTRRLGLDGELIGTREETRRTFVLRDGHLHEIPQGLSGLVPSRLGPLFRSSLFTPMGKARIALERFVPVRRGDEDESLGSFMRRRFGPEAYEHLMEPLLSGIYGGDGDALSLLATFPQLRALEQQYGSVLRGVSATRSRATTASRPGFVAFLRGMGSLVEALEGALGEDIVRRDEEAVAVYQEGHGVVVETANGGRLEADAVVLATPAYVTSGLIRSLDAEAARLLDQIPYASTATVSLAFDVAAVPPLDGHGYIVPRGEGRPVLACTWTSSKFEARAPPGAVLVRAFVGRAGQDEVLQRPDGAVTAVVREELEATLGVSAEPARVWVCRWERAMPQYTLGHLARVARIEERVERLGRVALAGAAYRGVGIPDCIASGLRAADTVARFLVQASAA